ncbi:MAG TPA: sulfate adenylyltransferase [bacterium]|nr:sulfate adenylyltransferase [bacterium]HOL47111.1 sulfate adenylyltransferase [bacterium]HPQ18865.1 sulfate adenylyltransferase [bacterium]
MKRELINRIITNESEKEEIIKKAKELKKIKLNPRQLSDVKMISNGGYTPIEGFFTKKDYLSVVNDMRLSNGEIFSLPITLAISKEEAKNLKEGELAGLYYENDLIGVIEIEDKYEYNKEEEAKLVYGTIEDAHPGVKVIYQQGEIYIGGKIKVINYIKDKKFGKYELLPFETQKLFKEKKWKTIVAFQTRNPIHRAHEYLIKCALEMVDGCLIHPIVGETKSDDIPAEIRMNCYEILIEKYFPKDRVILAINPASMRYAGPREAIFHSIIRRNYGSTHFIVGRDHAGVGNYYSPFAAQEIFYQFKEEELGIKPIFFANSFYCKKCESMGTEKTCPHLAEDHFSLSGTKVRELLRSGEIPPKEFTRPEIANILIDWWQKK